MHLLHEALMKLRIEIHFVDYSHLEYYHLAVGNILVWLKLIRESQTQIVSIA